MAEERSVAEVFEQLRRDGYAIGSDKRQRLSEYGIVSERRGRRYIFSAQIVTDLQYILEIEKRYELGRDHDGLALELAYRGYHTIPWQRAHRSAQKRIAILFNEIDREIHRANNWGASGFHPRRIPHLARQLAKHFVPTKKMAADPASVITRELAERVAVMLLRAIYNGEPFSERDVRALLLGFAFPEDKALDLAPKITTFANLAGPWLSVSNANGFRSAVADDADDSEVQAAIQTMNNSLGLLGHLGSAMGVRASFTVERYPQFNAQNPEWARTETALHNVFYAFALQVNRDQTSRTALERYVSGRNPDIESSISHVANLTDLLRKR